MVLTLLNSQGGVGKCVTQLGYAVRSWDIRHGQGGDLTKRVVATIVKDVSHLVFAAMLAPPCSSFSVARDRTSVSRDKQFHGVKPGLPKHEQ